MNRAIILIYWLTVRLAERLFTNDADVNSAFAAAASHYYYAVVYTGATVALVYMFRRDVVRIQGGLFVRLQLGLYLYASLTSIWSIGALVSIGQSVYSLYALLFAVSLAKYAMREGHPVTAVNKLLRMWIDLLLIDYVVDAVFFLSIGSFGLPSIDEKALVAMAAFMLNRVLDQDKLDLKRIGLLWMFGAGKSFSAILASVFILSRYISGRVGRSIGLVFGIGLVWIIYQVLELVQAGQLSIYGKSWEYILSGSGRFHAWEYLYDEIILSDWGDLVFGHGFMSERTFLSNQYLTWSIDAHSSILQSMYGVGLVGTSIMVVLWLSPYLAPRHIWRNVCTPKFWHVLVGCHTAFIVFGLTSSHYFSRPSISAIFMTSIMCTLYNIRHNQNRLTYRGIEGSNGIGRSSSSLSTMVEPIRRGP